MSPPVMLIRTTVAPSAVHGLGVFTAETVRPGTCLWTFHPLLDWEISDDQARGLPEAAREFLRVYGYVSKAAPDRTALNGDDGRFMNHSADPNTDFTGPDGFARYAIAAGAEITCDYREFGSPAWIATLPFLKTT